MRFVPFPLPGTADIFGESILMVLRENATGILISSKEIADHFKQYFDGVWWLSCIGRDVICVIAALFKKSEVRRENSSLRT